MAWRDPRESKDRLARTAQRVPEAQRVSQVRRVTWAQWARPVSQVPWERPGQRVQPDRLENPVSLEQKDRPALQVLKGCQDLMARTGHRVRSGSVVQKGRRDRPGWMAKLAHEVLRESKGSRAFKESKESRASSSS